jgi:chemotaxis methyl-accepting protein methylase
VARQNDLLAKEYTDLMMDKLEEAQEGRFQAMTEIEKEKLQTAKAYNKRVKEKSFQVRNLVEKRFYH